MNFRSKLALFAVLGLSVLATNVGLSAPKAAEANNPSNRIIVYVDGPQGGKVDIDVMNSMLPDLLLNEDTGEYIFPTNYCGLRITKVGAIWWDDGFGNLIPGEVGGEISWQNGAYRFMGQDVTNYYLGGVEFTGALDTCDGNQPWYFPTPLSMGGNGPAPGAKRLILELDQPNGPFPSIEFLDHAMEPVEFPDLYEDWEPLPGWNEHCEKIPEFCEEEEDPTAPDLKLAICLIYQMNCDDPDESRPGLGLKSPGGVGVAPLMPGFKAR